MIDKIKLEPNTKELINELIKNKYNSKFYYYAIKLLLRLSIYIFELFNGFMFVLFVLFICIRNKIDYWCLLYSIECLFGSIFLRVIENKKY